MAGRPADEHFSCRHSCRRQRTGKAQPGVPSHACGHIVSLERRCIVGIERLDERNGLPLEETTSRPGSPTAQPAAGRQAGRGVRWHSRLLHHTKPAPHSTTAIQPLFVERRGSKLRSSDSRRLAGRPGCSLLFPPNPSLAVHYHTS